MAKRTNHTVEPLFVQQIVDMYSSGKNQKEIVETTGQTYCVVRYWLKKKGLFDPGRRQTWTNHATQGLKISNERLKQEAETRLAFSLLEKGIAYLGGYDGKDSTVSLSCLSCGNEFTRYADKQFKNSKTTECPFCGEKAKAKAEKEAERIKQREEYERQLEHRKQLREERELKKQNKLNEIRICKECGCLYTYRSYAQSIGVDPIFVQRIDVCSRKCLEKRERKINKKYNYSHGKHKLRALKYGVEYDASVNLDDLIAKDGLRCALCGEMCNISDYKKVDGHLIYGNKYPSIDHIIPMSKGGGHVWDNVQVAHRICNSLKGANVAS